MFFIKHIWLIIIIIDLLKADNLISYQTHSLDDNHYRYCLLDIEREENTNMSQDSSLINVNVDNNAEEKFSLQMLHSIIV